MAGAESQVEEAQAAAGPQLLRFFKVVDGEPTAWLADLARGVILSAFCTIVVSSVGS